LNTLFLFYSSKSKSTTI